MREIESAEFKDVVALGVEGPGWVLSDFDARCDNPVVRQDLLDVAKALEREPSIIGASAHILGIGKKG